jgi:hypothetical protein
VGSICPAGHDRVNEIGILSADFIKLFKYQNSSSGCLFVRCGRSTDRQTDMTKQAVAFRNFYNPYPTHNSRDYAVLSRLFLLPFSLSYQCSSHGHSLRRNQCSYISINSDKLRLDCYIYYLS